MRSLVLGLLLPCLSFPALAQAVFHGENVIIHFYSEPCEYEPMVRIMQPYGEPKKALVVFDGQRYKACWLMEPGGNFLVLDEAGDAGMIPSAAVKPGA